MAIEKRVSKRGVTTYRVRLRMTDHEQVSRTFTRRADAQEFEARSRLAMRSGQWGPQCEARRHTLAEAIDRYLELLPTLQLKDERNRRRHARWWRDELGPCALVELTPMRLASARDALLVSERGRGRGKKEPSRTRSAATVVRYLASLSAILTRARDDWGWLPDNPLGHVRRPRQPEGRTRYLSDAEREALLQACRESRSAALYDVVVLAIATGMRKGEILSLRWRQVDLERAVITLDHTKNGKPRQIPLVGQVVEIVKALRGETVSLDEYVFAGKCADRPLDIAKAWTTAVRKARGSATLGSTTCATPPLLTWPCAAQRCSRSERFWATGPRR